MYPDDFFATRSECIDEFLGILHRSVLFTEYPHTLRCHLAIRVEELVDEVDDDKCTRHIVVSKVLESYGLVEGQRQVVSIEKYLNKFHNFKSLN